MVMQIDQLDIFHVAMPLLYPWRTAYGEDKEIHSVLVKATSGDYTAWTESTPFFAPHYLPESAGSVFYHVSEIFGPHIVGIEYETATDLNNRLGIFKGNSFAKAAIEMCFWTLESSISHIPLHKLLGGETREVSAGADFGIQDSIDMLLSNIQKAVDSKFPRIKLKIAKGWDFEVLKAVRSTFPDTKFHIDCNAGYTLDDIQFFKSIDGMGLEFIEQPLHYADVLDHAELAKQISTPICLDETIISVKAAEQAIKVGACKYINIKPGRIGGLSNAIEVHNLASNEGIPVWVGGMLESALGAAICIELATLPNFTYPGDLFPSSRYYRKDLSSPQNELTARNTFKPFTGPLPSPDSESLIRYKVQSKTVSPHTINN